MLYFAYGSNMNWEQMHKRCPSAQFIDIAVLPDYRLAFTRCSTKRKCGVADMSPQTGDKVWGVVYQIPDTEIAQLDKCEGFAPNKRREDNAYVREERHVFRNPERKHPRLVQVYFANPEDTPPLPSEEYKRLIIGGAEYWHLPPEYIDKLRGIETNSDSEM